MVGAPHKEMYMERLTFPGNFCEIAMCSATACIGTCSQKEVWERLKKYEDTGLSPEEIKALIKAKE